MAVVGQAGLEVDRPVRAPAAAQPHQAGQAHPGGHLRLDAQEHLQGGSQINHRDRLLHDPRREPPVVQDQGDQQGRVVGLVAVGQLVVLPQSLAVVPHHGRQQIDVGQQGADPLQQAPDLPVDEGHLGGVLAPVELGPRKGLRRRSGQRLPQQRGGGLEGEVRVEVVHPQEEGRAQASELEELQRLRGHLVGGPLVLVQGGLELPAGNVEVDVEALIEPEARVEDEGAHHRPGGVAAPGEVLGQGGEIAGYPEDGVVPRAVLEGIQPGEHRGVGRQGDGGDRAGLLEAHPLPGQAVEVGAGPGRPAVAAQAIGPGGVEGDQEEAGALGHRRISPGAGGSQEAQHEQPDRPDPRGTRPRSGGGRGLLQGLPGGRRGLMESTSPPPFESVSPRAGPPARPAAR